VGPRARAACRQRGRRHIGAVPAALADTGCGWIGHNRSTRNPAPAARMAAGRRRDWRALRGLWRRIWAQWRTTALPAPCSR